MHVTGSGLRRRSHTLLTSRNTLLVIERRQQDIFRAARGTNRGYNVKDEKRTAPQASADVTRLYDASRTRSDADPAETSLLARAPRTIAETGLDQTFLLELVAKSAFVMGKVSLSQLVQRLKLGASVLDSVVSFGVRERILEIVRRGASDLDVEL